MSWENIIKRKKPVPNASARKKIDEFMATVEGKVTVRDVLKHLMKKMGVMMPNPKTVRVYLFGWHSEKVEDFDPNTMRVDDYYYDLEWL